MASSLAAELHCAICLDFYSNPRILPCQHSFCYTCLVQILKAPPDQAKAVLCPSCRQKFAIGELGIDTFPRNFMLASIVDKFQETHLETMTEEKSKPCDLCEGESKGKATKCCKKCEASYCDSCFQIYHPMRGPLAKHVIQAPGKVTTAQHQEVITCPDHEGKELDMYCETCERPICYLCDRIGGHHEHRVCDIQKAFARRKVSF